MIEEEIDYWLKLFSNNNQAFMSKDGKKITLFKVFQELKELHFLLKIKNDYIKELEGYKHNLDRDCLRLEKEKEEVIKEIIEYLHSKQFEENFPYEANEYQVRGAILHKISRKINDNKLLEILKGGENE